MKKIIPIVAVIVVIVAVVIMFIPKKGEAWRHDSNPSYGFEFDYPADFILSEIKATTTPPVQLHDVAFLALKKSNTYIDNNFFTVSFSPKLENVFAYFQVPSSVPLKLGDYVAYYKTHMSDYKFPPGSVWSEETINNIHYYKLTATGIQSYFVEHNGIYVLTFLTNITDYSAYVKEIPHILSSFTFTK
jgi:hypothetical protein